MFQIVCAVFFCLMTSSYFHIIFIILHILSETEWGKLIYRSGIYFYFLRKMYVLMLLFPFLLLFPRLPPEHTHTFFFFFWLNSTMLSGWKKLLNNAFGSKMDTYKWIGKKCNLVHFITFIYKIYFILQNKQK